MGVKDIYGRSQRVQEAVLMPMPDQQPHGTSQSSSEDEVLRQLRTLRFGQITATIHDGRIVQIDRLERARIGQRHQPPKNT
jgi:hypothetical protein